MAGDPDSEFLQRFSLIEKELIALDSSTLDDFHNRWTTLVDDLVPVTEFLSDATMTTIYALVHKVSMVLQPLLDVELLVQRLSSALLDESPSTAVTPSQLETPVVSFPAYIKASCDWLVNNIHNPYPSSTIRDAIVVKSAAARKDVDNWFIDARKRIGWNDARKRFFSNKRIDIVDAATRFFANDQKLSLSQEAEHALITIMKNAKNLYSDKFYETMLASKLASAVKDLTPETKAQAKAERLQQLKLKKDRAAYPSPERSPEPSQLSPIPFGEEDDSAVQAISVVGQKRRSSSTEISETEERDDSRSVKRSRLDTVSLPTGTATGLPSPTSSVDELLPVAASSEISLTPSNPPTSNRKRRLSESDGKSIQKRPRHVAPDFQTVSDPLPLDNDLLFDDSSFDGWFQQTFDCPEASEISPTGFAVELGNISEFTCKTPAESGQETPVASEQSFEPPTFQVPNMPAVSDALWNDFDINWNESLPIPSLTDSGCLINFAASHGTDEASHLPLALSLIDSFVETLPATLAHAFSSFEMSSQALQASNDYQNIFGQPIVIPRDPLSTDIWTPSSSLTSQNNVCDFGKHNGCFEPTFPESFDFVSPSDLYLPPVPQEKDVQEKLREAYATIDKLQKEIQQSKLRPSEVVAL
ncbi:hypothetical protein H0H92_006395 [Tricholoma furcatifolium]|nr:hypothetical protein H0H92_006395 [Tricholoma furcatifolium]